MVRPLRLKKPGETYRGQYNPAWAARFPTVRAKRLRLIVTNAEDDASRIGEFEFFTPASQ